jgi:hypothetical protein
MRKLIFLSTVFVLSIISLSAQEKKMAEFKSFDHDFGTVQEGEGNGGQITTVFKFTNTSTSPIFIESANASCGCTKPKVDSSRPIAPGEMGEIPITYNTVGRPGSFTKVITITFKNALEERTSEKLYIRGNVIPKERANTVEPIKVEEKASTVQIEKKEKPVSSTTNDETSKTKKNKHHKSHSKKEKTVAK